MFVSALLLLMSLLAQGTARPDTPVPEKLGIGAAFTKSDSTGVIRVLNLFKNGPAECAGLRRGDEVVKVDGQAVALWSFDEFIDHVLVREPAPLHLTVRRAGNQMTLEIQRMKFSDIVAGAGYRLVPNADSTNYSIVPLDERAPLQPGDVVEFAGLRDAQCREAGLKPFSGNTVAYFWASWCGPCKLLMKRVAEEKIDPTRVRIIGLNIDETCERFHAFADSLRTPGEQFWTGGPMSDVSQALRVYRRGVPTTALLDRHGCLVTSAVGVDSALVLIRSAQR